MKNKVGLLVRFAQFFAMIFAMILALSLTAIPASAQLAIGAEAPNFSINAALAGKPLSYTLREALTKGPVVIYFYPKSFTSVCTAEAHEFSEAQEQFTALGASVIGISADDLPTQLTFSAKECGQGLVIGADPTFQTINEFRAASERGPYARRVSYVISPQGKILSVFESPASEKHIVNALHTLEEQRSRKSSK